MEKEKRIKMIEKEMEIIRLKRETLKDMDLGFFVLGIVIFAVIGMGLFVHFSTMYR